MSSKLKIIRSLGFALLLLTFSCDDTPYDPTIYTIQDADLQDGRRTLIAHPYIFEEEGLKLIELSYKRRDSVIDVRAVLQGAVEPFKECNFFLHAYPNAEIQEMDNLGGAVTMELDRLIHERSEVIDSQQVYDELRFGLACESKRFITRAVENIRFE